MIRWLDRQVAGVIDFRLDTDSASMTLAVLDRRIREYYRQLDQPPPAQTAADPEFDDPLDI